MTENDERLKRRVAAAAEEALARQGLVTALELLTGLGWLHPAHVDLWRKGRVPDLEQLIQVGPDRVGLALELLFDWASAAGLQPAAITYPARSRARAPLRFSARGDEVIDRAFGIQWLSPKLTARERERLLERQGRAPDLVVIQPLEDFTCAICGTEQQGLLIMQEPGPACMSCADMDHLVFLPAGDAALTRRAKAGSRLWAVVVRFSRARRRYERQGILVEEQALGRAEASCLADEEARARRRGREQARRARLDLGLQQQMAAEIQRLFPGCPPERARQIADHAAARGSGWVGRSAAGRALEERALELAVAASIRHQDTRYDELLVSGAGREAAREQVRDQVARTMQAWRSAGEQDAAATPHPLRDER